MPFWGGLIGVFVTDSAGAVLATLPSTATIQPDVDVCHEDAQLHVLTGELDYVENVARGLK